MNMFVAKCYRNFLPTSFIIYISKLGDEFWNLFILSFLLSKDVHVHEFSPKKEEKRMFMFNSMIYVIAMDNSDIQNPSRCRELQRITKASSTR